MTTPPIQDEFYAAHLAWLRETHARRWSEGGDGGGATPGRQEPAAK